MSDFFITKQRNIALGEIAACGVQVFGPRAWDDAEFDEFIDLLISRGKASYRPLAITFGAASGVTASQRRRLSERVKRDLPLPMPHAAVITSSAAVRMTTNAVGTAMRMVGRTLPLASFRPDDLEGALRWAKVEGDAGELRRFLRLLAAEVGHRPEVIATLGGD